MPNVRKLSPEDMYLLGYCCKREEHVSYRVMARIFKVSYPTIGNWVEKFFPEEYYRRQREREGVWRNDYLPLLRIVVLIQKGTIVDVANAFDTTIPTAGRWVREHLGQEVYQGTLRQRGAQLYPPELRDASREMRRNGMAISKIQQKLSADFYLLREVSLQLIYKWCKDIPRFTDVSNECDETDDTFFVDTDGTSIDEEEGPSDDDLCAIEEEIMKGNIYNEGF